MANISSTIAGVDSFELCIQNNRVETIQTSAIISNVHVLKKNPILLKVYFQINYKN